VCRCCCPCVCRRLPACLPAGTALRCVSPTLLHLRPCAWLSGTMTCHRCDTERAGGGGGGGGAGMWGIDTALKEHQGNTHSSFQRVHAPMSCVSPMAFLRCRTGTSPGRRRPHT
jgi:hypothetical protein